MSLPDLINARAAALADLDVRRAHALSIIAIYSAPHATVVRCELMGEIVDRRRDISRKFDRRILKAFQS